MRTKKPQLLSIDKGFKPALVNHEDELYQNGIFVFNITKMTEHLCKHKDGITPESIEIKVYRSGFAVLTENHIDKTDITVPIILAEIRPGWYNVIDGNHRLEKAYRMGVDYVKGYKLKPEQHMPFLISLNAYHAYVEYWNSKIMDDQN